MALHIIGGYDTNDVTIHLGSDPFSDFNDANGSAIGTVISVATGPDQIQVNDDDPTFDETDADQEVAVNTSQNGGTAPAGTDIDPEYSYLIRPVGSTNPADYFEIHVYEMGIGPGADGFVADQRLITGQQYEIIQITSESPTLNYSSIYVCFTPGTRIAAAQGQIPVETLEPGDLVRTSTGRFVPVQWVGSRWIGRRDLERNPRLRPICVPAGALGQGVPERPLILSRHHRVMLRSAIAKRMFGQSEVLIPVHHLIGQKGIRELTPQETGPVGYFHVLLEDHRVLLAEGAPAESLYLGEQTEQMLGDGDWDEIAELMPKARQHAKNKTMSPARPLADGAKANRLAGRHRDNWDQELLAKPSERSGKRRADAARPGSNAARKQGTNTLGLNKRGPNKYGPNKRGSFKHIPRKPACRTKAHNTKAFCSTPPPRSNSQPKAVQGGLIRPGRQQGMPPGLRTAGPEDRAA